MKTYRLFDLNEHIRRVVALNYPDAVWVECELAQLGQSRGHYYLSLIEKSEEDDTIIAQMDAILWQRTYKSLYRKMGIQLNSLLREGLQLKLKVRLDFNERFGLKLLVEDIDPAHTLGQLELQRQQILKQLHAEGFIGKNAALALPPVIQRIAVISSEKAAGYLDYRLQLQKNAYSYAFVNIFFNAAMQGQRVETEVLAQLKKIERQQERYDCVVIIRGGGARLDLAAFDSYNLAATVAQFPLPVLSGIGHEVDDTVLDQVAHSRLKTPTAVADFIILHNAKFEASVEQLGQHIYHLSQQQLQQASQKIQQLAHGIHYGIDRQLLQQQHHLEQVERELFNNTRHTLNLAQQQLSETEKLLALLDPEATLQRGYSITEHEGKIIRKDTDLKPGAKLRTLLADSELESTLIKRKKT